MSGGRLFPFKMLLFIGAHSLKRKAWLGKKDPDPYGWSHYFRLALGGLDVALEYFNMENGGCCMFQGSVHRRITGSGDAVYFKCSFDFKKKQKT